MCSGDGPGFLSFGTSGVQFSLSDVMPVTKLHTNYGKTALNKEIPVHERQQKVKHKELKFSVGC